MTRALLLAAIIICAPLRAENESWRQWISVERFKQVAVQAAQRVDLFQKIWQVDPAGQFYGGTSRDLLWFLRRELSKSTSRADLDARIAALLARPIDAREFIVGQSDVDVITNDSMREIDYDKQFITRVEPIDPKWFLPGHDRFTQEATQGGVPVEKIRLGKTGFVLTEGLDSGDGIREIYECRPTMRCDPRIVDTEFYKKHENHPLLLALRYLRQAAIAYFQRFGNEYPTEERLAQVIDRDSMAKVREILGEIRKRPDSLKPFIENSLFLKRLNKALGKSFRSYTNPTAARVLFQTLEVDKLLEHYGDKVEKFHTLVYTKYRNEADLAHQREQLATPHTDYLLSMEEYFRRNGIGEMAMYHGTPSMENYRNIVFQGNVASEGGMGGAGVYAVDEKSKKFAET